MDSDAVPNVGAKGTPLQHDTGNFHRRMLEADRRWKGGFARLFHLVKDPGPSFV